MNKNNNNEHVINYKRCWEILKNYIKVLEMMSPESKMTLSSVMEKMEKENYISVPVQ